MKWYQTIKVRFALLYAVTALMLGLIYSGCMVYVQIHTEEQLMSSTMDSILTETVEDDIQNGKAPKLDALSEIYIQGDAVRPIPRQFKNLPEGYVEYMDDEELHVYTKTINGKRYVLTRLQEDFENWERRQLIYGCILLGFVILLSFGLGFYAIQHSFKPLDRLITETRELDRRLKAGILDEMAFSGVQEKNEIGELTESFQVLTKRLEKLWEGERRFASEVSHELRTPMTVIGMSIEMLEGAENLTDRQKEIVQRAKRTSIRMNELLEVFLNISRGTTGKSSSVASITEVVEELLPTWQMEADTKGLSLVYSNAEENRWRVGETFHDVREEFSAPQKYNAVLVAAIFNNLVMNAIRYTDKGPITIDLDVDGFSIQDTGAGIDIHDKEHIFDAGYRGSVMENSGKVGYGLGLAIALRVCAILGWQIGVDSEVGKGTVFKITTASVR